MGSALTDLVLAPRSRSVSASISARTLRKSSNTCAGAVRAQLCESVGWNSIFLEGGEKERRSVGPTRCRGETCIGRIGRRRTSSGLCRNLAVSFSASSTQCSWRTRGRRVHIPAPLGKKSRPTIASRTLLLPLDWPPTTTIWGRHRHTDGRSWRRVASTLSPASAHASWVGGARGWESGRG